jgi:hypothetical protein
MHDGGARMIRWRGITIDRYRCSIAHGGAEILFSGAPQYRYRGLPSLRFRLACALLLAGPKTKLQLFDLLYGADIDGGPLEDRGVIDVMICRVKKEFARIGIDLRSESARGHNGRMYFAEPFAIGEAHYLEAAE